VRVLKSELGDPREWDEGMKLKWTVGWDPSEGGEVCAGPPTVTVFNFTSQWLEVDPWDIRVEVCPMQEVIRFDRGGGRRTHHQGRDEGDTPGRREGHGGIGHPYM
jgi:hypothetical protein